MIPTFTFQIALGRELLSWLSGEKNDRKSTNKTYKGGHWASQSSTVQDSFPYSSISWESDQDKQRLLLRPAITKESLLDGNEQKPLAISFAAEMCKIDVFLSDSIKIHASKTSSLSCRLRSGGVAITSSISLRISRRSFLVNREQGVKTVKSLLVGGDFEKQAWVWQLSRKNTTGEYGTDCTEHIL